MGGWHLEVFKMVVYIAFPVATFHFFNDSDWFLNRVIEGKREQMKFVDKAQNRVGDWHYFKTIHNVM